MRLRLAVAADYANRSFEGKLNIMGIFHEIAPSALPASLQQGFLVMEWEAGPAELGTQRDQRIAFIGPDGTEKVAVGVQLQVPAHTRPGSPAVFNQIIDIAGTGLERPGEHAFYILVGGDEKGRVSVYVHEPSTGGAS